MAMYWDDSGYVEEENYPWENYILPKDIVKSLEEIERYAKDTDNYNLEYMVNELEKKIRNRMWLVSIGRVE